MISIFGRRQPRDALERAAEVMLVAEADGKGDLIDHHIRFIHQLLRHLHAVAVDKIVDALAVFPLEDVAEIIRGIVEYL